MAADLRLKNGGESYGIYYECNECGWVSSRYSTTTMAELDLELIAIRHDEDSPECAEETEDVPLPSLRR